MIVPLSVDEANPTVTLLLYHPFFPAVPLVTFNVHVGFVLSIYTFFFGHAAVFPALSFAVPGEYSPPFVSAVIFLVSVALTDSLVASVTVPVNVTSLFVQLDAVVVVVHYGAVTSTLIVKLQVFVFPALSLIVPFIFKLDASVLWVNFFA